MSKWTIVFGRAIQSDWPCYKKYKKMFYPNAKLIEMTTEKFEADHKTRLPEATGNYILAQGKRIGESERVKGSCWAGYLCEGKYYLSLDDDAETFWEVSEAIVKEYCDLGEIPTGIHDAGRMKNIQDYLHLYSGCEVDTPDGLRKMWCYNPLFDLLYVETKPTDIAPSRAYFTYHFQKIKPILRPLTSMTEEELLEQEIIVKKFYPDFEIDEEMRKNALHRIKETGASAMLFDEETSPFLIFEITRYLLFKSFDLFNLIPEGLAIDSTTLTTQS